MRERTIGAVFVVVIGILPTLFGGPIFLILLLTIGLLGYREFQWLSGRIGTLPSSIAYSVILAFPVAGLTREPLVILLGVVLALGLPFAQAVFQAGQYGVPHTDQEEQPTLGIPGWSITAAGTLYLGLPMASAAALRNVPGTSDSDWLNDLANTLSLGWEAHPVGLGWTLTLIIITWFGDTAAYLVGRSLGRRPLMLKVSPKKTIAGSIGGLVGSAVGGALGVWAFGLATPALGAALIGVLLGIFGQIGDLAESLLKRQAGVKDSGQLIRGHGGMLDRVDSMLVILTLGWLIVELAYI
jgi:phosphatidate cytidylyltransferase